MIHDLQSPHKKFVKQFHEIFKVHVMMSRQKLCEPISWSNSKSTQWCADKKLCISIAWSSKSTHDDVWTKKIAKQFCLSSIWCKVDDDEFCWQGLPLQSSMEQDQWQVFSVKMILHLVISLLQARLVCNCMSSSKNLKWEWMISGRNHRVGETGQDLDFGLFNFFSLQFLSWKLISAKKNKSYSHYWSISDEK